MELIRSCCAPGGLVEEFMSGGRTFVYVNRTATTQTYEECLRLLGDGWTADCQESTIVWTKTEYKNQTTAFRG